MDKNGAHKNKACTKAIVKLHGSNFLHCKGCKATTCYLCGQQSVDASHFYDRRPGQAAPAAAVGKCLLYSKEEKAVHYNDVANAAKEAMKKMEEENPEVRCYFHSKS